MDQNQKNAKSESVKSRIFIKIIAGFIAVIVAIGFAAILNELLSDRGIRVGDAYIKERDIDVNAKDIEDASKKEENGLSILGGKTASEKSRDDLILNAGLKNAIRDCKVDIDLNIKAISNYRGMEESVYNNLKGYQKISIENDYLKANLENCLIERRSYFGVAKMYADLGAREVESVKDNLNQNVLPLFRQNKSDEDIAAFVQKEYPDYLVFYAGEDANDDINLVPEPLRGEALHTESFENLFNDIGDNSGVVVRQNGELGVYRLKVRTGKYRSWSDFFIGINKDIAQKSNILALSFFNNQASAATVTGQAHCISNWHIPSNYTQNNPRWGYESVTTHVVKYNFIFVDSKTGARIQGVKVNMNQLSSPAVSVEAGFCVKDMYGHTDGNGSVDLWANCYTGSPVATFETGGRYRGGKYSYTTQGSRFSWTYYEGRRRDWDSKNGLVNFPNNTIDNNGVGVISDGPSGIDRIRFFGGINGANVNIVVYLEPVPQPPADIPDNPSYTSDAKTFIKNDQTQTSWIKDKSIIAPVGSTVSYRHTIEANFSSKYSKFYLNWSRVNGEMPDRQRNKNNVGLSLGSNSRGNVVDDQSSFKVLNSDLGRTVCERVSYGWNMDYFYNKGISENTYQITAKPSENIVKSGLWSAPACFYVPYHYELTPCMVYDKGVCGGVDIPGEPGGSIPVTPSVSNTSGGTNSRNDTKWIVTSWNIPGSNEGIKTKSGVIDNNISDPCSVYRGLYGVNLNNCSIIKNGEQSFEAAKITNLAVQQITIPENAEIGSRYCIGISVSPYRLEKGESQSSQNQKVGSQWRHSAPICVLATKKPKLQVWGNGIYSRGGIRTSLSNYGGKGVFGSWVEFEAMSEGLIDGFRSEASHTTNNLTFTNRVSNKGKWGQWSGRTDRDSIINNIRSRYPASRDGIVVESINGTYGGVNGNSPANRNVNTRIINSTGMYITGNIISKAVSGPNNLKAFQQTIIIVDGDLYINKDVTQIDAWLIVRGKIVTCAVSAKERSDIVNNSNCGKNLIINGPVISGSLKSWRTGNSDYNSPDVASEVYNQRADVYLWAYAQGSESGKVTTTYTKELPVRY